MHFKKLFPTSLYHLVLFLAGMAVALVSSCNNGNAGDTEDAQTTDPQQTDEGFISIFDGETLDGWEGSPDNWRVENGAIVGYTSDDKPLENNTFLIWRDGQPSDFELKLEFKISETGNSGVQYRSEELQEPPLALKGYQADIDGKNTYTGQNYEERGRGFLAKRGEIAQLNSGEDPAITGSLGDGDELKGKIKAEDWNTLRIVAEGNHLKHFINGTLMSEVTDNDTGLRKMRGHLGLQVHKGPPMEVRYRNIQYKDLNGM